jgi:hypothetical protein
MQAMIRMCAEHEAGQRLVPICPPTMLGLGPFFERKSFWMHGMPRAPLHNQQI